MCVCPSEVLKYILNNLFRKIDRAWIGYNDEKDEGIFKWLHEFDGYSDGYTNWKSLGPNGGLKENCVEITSKNGGKWDDVNCDDERAFICERPGE